MTTIVSSTYASTDMSSFLRFCALVPLALALEGPAAADESPGTQITSDRLISHSTDTESFSSFIGHVVVDSSDLHIICDRLDTVSSRVGEQSAIVGTPAQFEHLQADGHVRITEGDREAVCGHAEVKEHQERIVLTRDPVVIDHSNATRWAGRTITLLRSQRAVIIDNAIVNGPPLKESNLGGSHVAPGAASPPAASPPPAPGSQ